MARTTTLIGHRPNRVVWIGLLLGLTMVASIAGCSGGANVQSGQQQSPPTVASAPVGNQRLININTASIEELASLPGIGEGLARQIVEHRKKHGRFRRIEHLLIVEGVSEKSFEDIRYLITIE